MINATNNINDNSSTQFDKTYVIEEYFRSIKEQRNRLSPAAQLVILRALLKSLSEVTVSQLSEELNYSKSTNKKGLKELSFNLLVKIYHLAYTIRFN